jgi:dTDP-4-dehydrorhamnose reductase
MSELEVASTPIPGLQIVNLPLHGDSRGWFKENWQRQKMTELGLPDFGPVQNNISFNAKTGTTRGIHAEPWDKFISVAAGRIFGAWVDLREGPSFGAVFCSEIGPDKAVYIPRGVGNSFQSLEPNTVYAYLVNAHWTAAAQDAYTFVNAADQALAIPWPIPLSQAVLSEKDRKHPMLKDVRPMRARTTLVLGSNGQLGRALRAVMPDAEFADRRQVDITRPQSLGAVDWENVETVINAAAFTNVDEAETPQGRVEAWKANATGPANLARICAEHRITLVHISSDYVFDGSADKATENDSLAPLGVYGQTKAAGDIAVGTVPQHYIVRTSWVVGEGKNFVSTMQSLAERGVDPRVVNDQIGRLTLADDLASGIAHLLRTEAPFGTYNLTGSGQPYSWADIAARVFALQGHDAARVNGVTTDEYGQGRELAPRPARSVLSLSKIQQTGFTPRSTDELLAYYMNNTRGEGRRS